VKKRKNKNDEQPWTLAYPWALSLKLFFWSGLIGFPFKMMPCRQSHNLICLGLGPHLKALRPILKLLFNRNAQFHWTLLFRPFSKVTFLDFPYSLPNFSMQGSIPMCAKVKFSQVGECFSKNDKIVNFRDFFAIFRNKNC
jgi:hypothetical protein